MKHLSIISYNILAQRYTLPHINTRYAHVSNKNHLDWPYRKNLLIEFFSKTNADILCLQEVEIDSFEKDFGTTCNLLGYDYFRHTVNKKRTAPIGNVTLWKKNILSSTYSLETSCGIINHLCVLGNYTCQVINIHLRAGLSISNEQERKNQLISIIKKSSESHHPSLIIGDFNDELNENGLLCPLLKEFTMHNKQKTCCVTSHPPNEDFPSGKINFFAFDHVVSKGLNIKIETLSPNETLIPNESHPSDHYPLKLILNY